MELERDVRIVIVAHLDDENCIEPVKKQPKECKIRLNDKLRKASDLFASADQDEAEYVDGFQMKCHFIKSPHMSSFTQEQDRSIEITEATRRQSQIDVYKHYPINSFDLAVFSARTIYQSMPLNHWWMIYKSLIAAESSDDTNEKLIQLFCAPAFNLPLPHQIARQSACLIGFYEMFKTVLFSIYRRSSSATLLSAVSHILPAIKLSFRPAILRPFDERIQQHPRLKRLLKQNCLCLVANGSKPTSFRYDFSLIEQQISSQFNPSERQLHTWVKRFALKHLRCSLDNDFLRTSVLWICELHDLEDYHHIFEVWVSFMRDVCRKRFLPHYFLDQVNIFEEHPGLEEIIKTLNYENIDTFIGKLEEDLIFPYVYQYNDRMKILTSYLQAQPVLAFKMKTIYNVNVKSQFSHVDSSLDEMCSILCHLSFLEDNDQEHFNSFWHQQWKPLFVDFDRDDIVLRQPRVDARPHQLAQQMTASVLRLIQMDLIRMIEFARSKLI